jgi:hypothetical protein
MQPGAASLAATPVAAGSGESAMSAAMVQGQPMTAKLTPGGLAGTVGLAVADHINIAVSYPQIALSSGGGINVTVA